MMLFGKHQNPVLVSIFLQSLTHNLFNDACCITCFLFSVFDGFVVLAWGFGLANSGIFGGGGTRLPNLSGARVDLCLTPYA